MAWSRQKPFWLQVLLVGAAVPAAFAGLLGAGTGDGSCPAFPYRSTLLDHVAGCPRWSPCCTEFGYCHSKESWLEGNFRDCNGESNGSPLPGSVIRIEALQAAKGDTQMTAAILGISSEIWQQQVQIAAASLSSSSSSSSSFSGQSQAGFAGQSNFVSQSQTGLASQSGFASQSQSGLASQSGFASQSQSGFAGQSQAGFAGQSQSGFAGQSQAGFAGQSQASSFSTSDLVAQIVLALQPQVAETVQLAIQNSNKSSLQFNTASTTQNKRPRPQNAAALGLSAGTSLPAGGVSSGVDISLIVAQVLAAITPEITRVVQTLA